MAGGDGCGRRVMGAGGRTTGRITNFITKAEDYTLARALVI
jgi:hypothetical protein